MTRSGARGPAAGVPREAVNGATMAHQRLNGTSRRLGVAELERRMAVITRLLYDTSVGDEVLREKVHPHLAQDIVFWDPWVRARGLAQFWTGLRGFHAIVRFTFDIHQLAVSLDEDGTRARVLVDGVMNLNQLVVYTYPLRTQLVYTLVISPDGESFQIASLEEMWSLGDLIENAPGLRPLYEAFRRAWGHFFTGVFWLGANLVERLPRAPTSG